MNNSDKTKNGDLRLVQAGFRRCLSSLVGALLVGASLPAAWAASQFFDDAGGPLNWDATTTADWSATTGGPYNSLWTSGNTAIFEGTAGTVNVSDTDIPTCGGITFKSGGYTLSGGTIKVANNSAFTVGTAGLSATVSSVIADSSGACNVAFGNTSARSTFTLGGANTYSGKTTLVQNTIHFDSLADGGNPSSFGQGDSTTPVVLGNNASYSQANYTGNGGSTDRPWQIGGTGGGIIQNNGYGAISFNNLSPVVVGTAGNRKLTLQGNYTASASTFAGALVDMPGFRTSLEVKGATWNILGTNSYSGVTTISGGTLQLTNDMALGSPTGAIVFSASVTLAAINLGAAERNDVTIGAARTITVNSGKTAYFGTPDTNNLIVAAYITGAGGVRKQSSSYAFGTVRFTCDTNDYTGDFGINYGKVEFTSVANQGVPSSLGAATAGTGAITMGYGNSATTLKYIGAGNSSTTRPLVWQNPTTGCMLDASGAGTISYLASADLKQGSGSTYIRLQGTNTGMNTLAQVINDNGGTTTLQKQDAGTWVLTGVNTFSGTTTISGGTLSVSADSGLGTAPGSATPNFLVINGGALSASASFTLDANRGIALGPTDSNGNGTLDVAAGQTLSYAGIMTDAGSPNSGGLIKTGAGTLTLSGANTYTGDTTISGGTLALTGSGTLGTGTNLIINAGGTFDVSALGGGYTLSASQSLLVTNGATAAINGSLDVASASVVMTNNINTATLNVTGGALTLGGSTPFEVVVNNGGTPLGAGSYKLISKGTGGSVAGTAPSAVTVGGDGLAGGATASLAITGGELYLNVTGGATPSTPVISGIAITGGQAILTFSGTNGTWYVLSSTNVALPIANWVTNATGAFGSLGSVVSWTNSTPTAPQEFYRVKSQ